MAFAGSDALIAQSDQTTVIAEIVRQHDAIVQRLREWILTLANEPVSFSWHALPRLCTLRLSEGELVVHAHRRPLTVCTRPATFRRI